MWRPLVGLLVLIAACIPSPTPKLVPIPPQEPDSIGWHLAQERIAQADGVLVGKIVKLEEDWDYDNACGLLAIIMHRCDGTTTYRLLVRNEFEDKWLWTWAKSYGTFGLFTDESAVFIWSKVYAYKYKTCREQQAITSNYCVGDYLPTLTNDLDVLPVADSAKVDSIFHRVPK